MKRFITILLVQFFSFFGLAQNLVANPSFESNIACPSAAGQISNVISWFDLTSHTGTPDYFHTCASSANVAVPVNFWGNENAATGSAYVGMSLVDYTTADYREYIEVQLSTPLVAGNVYAISYKYSLADNSNYSTADFGLYFSAVSNAGTGTSTPLPLVPQVNAPVTLDNKAGWIVVTQNYVATGGEQYMLFGNFLDDAATAANFLGNFGFDGSYIYLDDFLIERICDYNLGIDTFLCQGQVLPLDMTVPNSTYLWQDNSTNGSFTVTQAGTYWVQITNAICGTITDSIVVAYNQPLSFDFGNDTLLCVGQVWTHDVTSPYSTYLWQDNSTNPIYNVSSQGDYWVQISNGCETISDTVNVTYLAALNVNLGNDIVLCQGNMLILNATSPYSTYLWQDNSTNPLYNVTQPGIYSVVVSGSCDTATASINVDYFDPLSPILGNDTVLCQGEVLLLDITSPNATYLWQDNSTDSTFEVSQQGSYWAEFTNSCGTTSDTINVSYLQSLGINLGNDTILCEGEQLTLDINIPNVDYLWQNNSTISTQTVLSPGLYYASASVPGCSIWDSINIAYQNLVPQFDYENTVTNCPKINTVNFTDQSTINFGSIDSYQWNFTGGSTSVIPNPTYVYYTFGDYVVELVVTSNLGCIEFIENTVSIDFYQEIKADFVHSPNIGIAKETILDFSNLSQNSTSWIWDFGDGHFSTEENPEHSYQDAGTYSVTLIAGNGIDCSDTAKHTLVINEQFQVFVPNAFSPSYSGPNRKWTFSVQGVDIYDFSMVVLNRWGEIIWESHDPSASWNGEYNGTLVPFGTYVWKMEINKTASSKGETFYGSLTVVR